MTDFIDLTATGQYFHVLIDGVKVSKHTTEREAIERATSEKLSSPDSIVEYTHEYFVTVGLTNQGVTLANLYQVIQDLPPTVVSTPNPQFTVGTAASYDMKPHFSDDAVSTVSYSIINILPNGLTFSSVTGILSYDGVAAASVSSHQARATDAVGQATTNTFNISIAVVAAANYTVRQDGTGTFTVPQTGYAAVQQGQVCEIQQNVLYDVPLVSVRNGTQALPVTIRGSSDIPRLGGGTNAVNVSCIVLTHSWQVIGPNITVKGDQIPGSAKPGAHTPENRSNVAIGAEFNSTDCTLMGVNFENCNTAAIQSNGLRNTIIGPAWIYMIGGINDTIPKGNGAAGSDYGDAMVLASSNDLEIGLYSAACLGHGAYGRQDQNKFYGHHLIGESLYDQEVSRDCAAFPNHGNRVGNFSESGINNTVEDFCYGPIGLPVETLNSPVGVKRYNGTSSRLRRGLIHGGQYGGSAIQSLAAPGEPGCQNLYGCYLTFWGNGGSALAFQDNDGTKPFTGMKYYNCSFFNNHTHPDPAQANHEILFIYEAGGTPWQQFAKFDGCQFPVGFTARLRDGQAWGAILTLADLKAEGVATANCFEANPQFVAPSITRVTRRLAYSHAQLATRYDKFQPLNGSLLGTAVPVMRLTAAANNATIITVDDTNWIRDNRLDSPYSYPEWITIIGGGTRKVTEKISATQLRLATPVNGALNAGIHLGELSAPNIGWWQGAGFYA